jgi:hypothetical protein
MPHARLCAVENVQVLHKSCRASSLHWITVSIWYPCLSTVRAQGPVEGGMHFDAITAGSATVLFRPLAAHHRSHSFKLKLSKTLISLQRWTSSATKIETHRGVEALLSEPSSEQELLANIPGRDVGRASKPNVDIEDLI